MSPSCICIGECMVELRPCGDGLYARGFAGDAFNTAVYLRRELGPAGEVAFLTAVGDEALSAALRDAVRAEALDDRLVFAVPGGAPGLYMIELDPRGDREFLYWRSASAARGWLRELQRAGGADALAGADLVYLSGISLAILPEEDRADALALMRALKGRVGRLAFDPNVRPRLWAHLDAAREAVEAAAAAADIVLPSSQDGDLLWGEADARRQLDRWRALGAEEVALTLAEQGATVAWAGGSAAIAPVEAERVVDTSGAGDSFNGAYLAARLGGAAPPGAARRGLELAAYVVAQPGAVAPPR